MSVTSMPVASSVTKAIAPSSYRDWSEEEKAFIRIAPALKENLLKVFRAKDDSVYWTPNNEAFLMSISS